MVVSIVFPKCKRAATLWSLISNFWTPAHRIHVHCDTAGRLLELSADYFRRVTNQKWFVTPLPDILCRYGRQAIGVRNYVRINLTSECHCYLVSFLCQLFTPFLTSDGMTEVNGERSFSFSCNVHYRSRR